MSIKSYSSAHLFSSFFSASPDCRWSGTRTWACQSSLFAGMPFQQPGDCLAATQLHQDTPNNPCHPVLGPPPTQSLTRHQNFTDKNKLTLTLAVIHVVKYVIRSWTSVISWIYAYTRLTIFNNYRLIVFNPLTCFIKVCIITYLVSFNNVTRSVWN